jgi:hypothetical protein
MWQIFVMERVKSSRDFLLVVKWDGIYIGSWSGGWEAMVLINREYFGGEDGGLCWIFQLWVRYLVMFVYNSGCWRRGIKALRV